ncbi:MAG: tRNA-dihydrouridine synthase [Methanobrevibacter sp.]|uniref:oxidoreductase n=1 Tax=Methanobrevibacter sp. TaxID=66852 RepID=UPI001B270425|nr:tRNA-dihydrouridine synthase [Methanobrevibacter sp.]MBO5151822.1 tRNA-dihydrouridine synthase [Methanobrevibacter sp.]MBO6110165.1 tRNA-dihydrouridine synthase [Methanobrevibacter sp.]
MKDIFDECQLNDLKLNSRIIRTGAWERETEDGGYLTPAVFDRYEKMASSGVGLILSEMFALDHKDRFFDYSANMNYKGFVKDYKQLTDICHNFNVPLLGQLAFFYYDDGDNQKAEPNDLTIEGIRKLQAEVIMAAKKFSFAGFDGIQINMGNNFYLSRFTNPYFNQRTDDYGGNTLNRIRIVLEIIKLIKKTIGFHVSCRINIEDVRKGGLTQEESMKMAKLLAENGADSIQITGRTISMKYDAAEKHVFQDYADKLSQEVDIPVILAGNLRDMKTMNDILNSSHVEFMSLSKPFVAQADFLADWKKNGEGTSRCKGCNNCYSKKESRCFQYDD